MKRNEAFFSVSLDDGNTWSPPKDVPRQFGGAVETASPMLITKSGTWLAGMCPHRAWDPSEELVLNRAMCARSAVEQLLTTIV